MDTRFCTAHCIGIAVSDIVLFLMCITQKSKLQKCRNYVYYSASLDRELRESDIMLDLGILAGVLIMHSFILSCRIYKSGILSTVAAPEFFGGGASRGEMHFWGAKIQKFGGNGWFGHFFWFGGKWGQCLWWGKMPPSPPLYMCCRCLRRPPIPPCIMTSSAMGLKLQYTGSQAKLLFHQSHILGTVTGQWWCSHCWQLLAAGWLHSWSV